MTPATLPSPDFNIHRDRTPRPLVLIGLMRLVFRDSETGLDLYNQVRNQVDEADLAAEDECLAVCSHPDAPANRGADQLVRGQFAAKHLITHRGERCDRGG